MAVQRERSLLGLATDNSDLSRSPGGSQPQTPLTADRLAFETEQELPQTQVAEAATPPPQPQVVVPEVEAAPQALAPDLNVELLQGIEFEVEKERRVSEAQELEFLTDIDQTIRRESEGFGSALKGGISRGAMQVATTIPMMRALAAKTMGDDVAAKQHSESALDWMQKAPQPLTDGLEDVDSLHTLGIWATERLGEFGPNVISMFGGAGVARGLAQLGSKGLLRRELSEAAARRIGYAGGLSTGASIETGGTAQEQFAATGDVDPKVAVAAGIAKGALEWAVPYRIGKRIKAGQTGVFESLGRGAFEEAVTEMAQESVDVAARDIVDPYFDVFTYDNAQRVANAFFAGGVGGGAFGGGGVVARDAIDAFGRRYLDRDRSLTSEEIDQIIKDSEAELAEEASGVPRDPADSPMAFVRRASKKAKSIPFENDIAASSLVAGGARHPFEASSVEDPEQDLVNSEFRMLDLIDAQTPRYSVQLQDGSWSNPVTDVDAQEIVALMPQNHKPQVVEVDTNSLVPAKLSADVKSIAKGNGQVYFMPWVTAENQTQLRGEFEQLRSAMQVAGVRSDIRRSPDNISETDALQRQYVDLMNRGLRVAPSRKGSFIYGGEVKGRPVESVPSARSVVVVPLDQPTGRKRFTTPQKFTFPGTAEASPFADPFLNSATFTIDHNQYEPADGVFYPGVWPDQETYQAALARARANPESVFYLDPSLTAVQREDRVEEWFTVAARNKINARELMLDLAQRGIQIRPEALSETLIYFAPLREISSEKLIPIESGPIAEARLSRTDVSLRPVKAWNVRPFNKEGERDLAAVRLVEREVTALAKKLEAFTKKNFPNFPPISFEEGGVNAYVGANSQIWISVEELKRSLKGFGGPNTGLAEWTRAVVLHEYGHYLAANSWTQLPLDVKELVRAGYRKALLYSRLTRRPDKTINIADNVPEYGLTFDEYLAEQFRRWATSESPLFDETFGFFKKTGRARDKLYNEYLSIGFTPQQATDMTHASWEFASAMAYMLESSKPKPNKRRLRKLARMQGPSIEPSPVVRDAWTRTREIVDQWKTVLPVDVSVDLSRSSELVEGELTTGEFSIGDRTILLWVGSLERLRATDSEIAGVFTHEALHAVWGSLTNAEQRTLVAAGRKAANAGRISFNAEGYRRDYRDALTEDNPTATREEIEEIVEQDVNEEYAAYLIEKRTEGGDFGEAANSIIDRILELFDRIVNLLKGDGFHSAESLIRAFYRGELARRADAQAANRDRRELTLEYIETGKLALRSTVLRPEIDGIVANVEDTNNNTKHYRFFDPTGEFIGFVDLSLVKGKGWEVDMVEVRQRYHRQGFGTRFYDYIQRDLGIQMQPSRVLYDPGYQFWKAREPNKLRYHVWSDVDGLWYSANNVRDNRDYWRRMLEEKKEAGAPSNVIQRVTAIVRKWENLYKKVDPVAWVDPEMKTMFARAVGQVNVEAAEAVKDTERGEANIFNGITGEGTTRQSDFERIIQGERRASQAQNARILGIPESQAAPAQAESRMVKRALAKYGQGLPNAQRLGANADRISFFSRMMLTIQQVAWRNPQNLPLQRFVNTIQQMVAYRMRIVNNADTVAKEWSNLPREQSEGLADLLFYLTEMKYRSPVEVRNHIVRQPTALELQAVFAQFNLTPEAIDVYNQVNNQFLSFLDQVEQTSIARANRIFANNPAGLQAALGKIQSDFAAMRSKPYFPMTRFGKWAITVRDRSGQVTWFSAYATKLERNAAVRDVVRMPQHRGMDVQVGAVDNSSMEFMGLPGPLIDQIMNPQTGLPGLSQTQREWLERFKLQNAPDRSFRKRWLERKGTPGYSLDALRVFSAYFQSGSNFLSKLRYQEQLVEPIRTLRDSYKGLNNSDRRHELVKMLERQFDYTMEGQDEFGKFRSVVALWHLTAPVAALVNLTQTPMVTLPTLGGIFGERAVLGLIRQKLKSTSKSLAANASSLANNPAMQAARQELQSIGKLNIGLAAELGAYAEGPTLLDTMAGTHTQKAWQQINYYGMWMFQATESLNRELTFSMAWDAAMADINNKWVQDLVPINLTEIARIMQTPYEVNGQPVFMTFDQALATIAAREIIDLTQFVYQPWARPRFLQGKISGLFFVFFGFMQSMLFRSLAKHGNVSRGRILLAMFLMGGLMGLPGAEDLEAVINAIAKRLYGKDWSPEEQARELIRGITEGTVLDQTGPDLFLHGVSRYSFGLGLLQDGYGIPSFDASANIGMGRIVPGAQQLAEGIGGKSDWSDVLAYTARDASGAGLSPILAILQYMQGTTGAPDQRALERALPRIFKNVAAAARYTETGREVTRSGETLVQFDPNNPDDMAAIVTKALGFTPTKVSEAWDFRRGEMMDRFFYQGRRTTLMADFFVALQHGDQRMVDKVREDIVAFNAEMIKNNTREFVINSKGLNASVKDRARRRALSDRGLPVNPNAVPSRTDRLDLYPGVKREIESRRVK